MTKYVKHDKASKSRRKKMVIVGHLSKAKAKQFLTKYGKGRLVEEYGTYLDGSVDIGYTPSPYRMNEKWIAYFTTKIAETL